MNLKKTVKSVVKKLDQLNPYPLFYPFVMSKPEKALFDEAIKHSRSYLEFGLGGSTIRAVRKSGATIHTVESSADWIGYMRNYTVIGRAEESQLHIFPVDIGPVGEWGFPQSDEFKDSFENYSSGIFQIIDGSSIDLALVDGRFRVACALKIILACHGNSGIRILFHDFWNRSRYHAVLQYLDTVNRADTLAVFAIKQDIDLNAVEKDYQAYKLIPD